MIEPKYTAFLETRLLLLPLLLDAPQVHAGRCMGAPNTNT
jgi:hypothetical protein